MKKVWIGILTVVTVLAVGTVSTFAAGFGQGRFAGTGICNGTGVCRYLDADRDGVCEACGADRADCVCRTGTGRSYQDENGDGICDHSVSGSCTGQ